MNTNLCAERNPISQFTNLFVVHEQNDHDQTVSTEQSVTKKSNARAHKIRLKNSRRNPMPLESMINFYCYYRLGNELTINWSHKIEWELLLS